MSKYTFDQVSRICQDKDVILVWNEDEFKEKFKSTKTNIEIFSACGHRRKVQFNNLLYTDTGIMCQDCNYNVFKSKRTGISPDYLFQEYQVIKSLEYFCKDVLSFKLTREGSVADFCVKPLATIDDLWLPIQIKTTKSTSYDMYKFTVNDKYKYIIIMLFYIDPNNNHKIWIIDGSDVANISNISIRLNSSVYDKYEIGTSNLSNLFCQLYNSKKKNPFQDFNISSSKQSQQELEYVQLRETLFPHFSYDYPEVGGREFDVIINKTYKVQDKVLTINYKSTNGKKNNKPYYIAKLCRGSRSSNGIQYKLGDNDYYWIFLPDKKGAYVIPEEDLYNNGLISTIDINEDAKSIVSFYPYADSKINYKTSWLNQYLYFFDNKDHISKINSLFDPIDRMEIPPLPVSIISINDTFIDVIKMTKRIFQRIRKDNHVSFLTDEETLPELTSEYHVKKCVKRIIMHVVDEHYASDMVKMLFRKILCRYNHKDETKRKISESVKAYFNSNEDMKNNLNIENHRAIMAKAKGRPVEQYTVNNVFVKDYVSIASAARETGTPSSTIKKNLLGKSSTAANFIWKYKNI